MEGDAPRVITRTVDEELSRNFFFFSLFFPPSSLIIILSSSFLSLIFPSHLSLSLPPFSGEQWRQWERVLSRFIVHCLVCGKVNLSASGHELRFIRRVKFGDKGRGFKSMEMPIGNYFSLLSWIEKNFPAILSYNLLLYEIWNACFKVRATTTIEEKLTKASSANHPLSNLSIVRVCSSTHGPDRLFRQRNFTH